MIDDPPLPEAAPGIEAVRVAIDLATPIPAPTGEPPRVVSPEERAAEEWARIRNSAAFSSGRFRHVRPGFLDRAPIKLHGVDECSRRRLYRDAEGVRRALRAEDHDRDGIASLFVGAERWLGRLWPAPGGGWDHEAAAETLFFFQSCIGLVNGRALEFVVDLPRLVRR
jgi:hypothetical protein